MLWCTVWRFKCWFLSPPYLIVLLIERVISCLIQLTSCSLMCQWRELTSQWLSGGENRAGVPARQELGDSATERVQETHWEQRHEYEDRVLPEWFCDLPCCMQSCSTKYLNSGQPYASPSEPLEGHISPVQSKSKSRSWRPRGSSASLAFMCFIWDFRHTI